MSKTDYLLIWCGILSVLIVILWDRFTRYRRMTEILSKQIDAQHNYLQEKKILDDRLIAEVSRLVNQARIIIDKFSAPII